MNSCGTAAALRLSAVIRRACAKFSYRRPGNLASNQECSPSGCIHSAKTYTHAAEQALASELKLIRRLALRIGSSVHCFAAFFIPRRRFRVFAACLMNSRAAGLSVWPFTVRVPLALIASQLVDGHSNGARHAEAAKTKWEPERPVRVIRKIATIRLEFRI